MANLMIDDPARELPPTAYSERADAALARILATSPHYSAERRPAAVKRIALGVLLAAAATTVALTTPWNGARSGDAAAYTVDRHRDGSVSVVVHWSQLADAAALQRTLDQAGAPVRILTGTTTSAKPPSPTDVPDCAKPYSGKPYSAAAVSWDSGADAPDSSFVVHPDAFPAHGILVIEVFFSTDTHQLVGSLSFMAIGRVPTCALPA